MEKDVAEFEELQCKRLIDHILRIIPDLFVSAIRLDTHQACQC